MHLTSTQLLSHLIQVSRFVCHLHPGPIPHRSKQQELHLISILVLSPCIPVLVFVSYFHPGLISPPSMHGELYQSSFQVPCHAQHGLKICVSSPFRLRLNSTIQVSIFTSQLQTGHVPNLSRPLELHHCSIKVPCHHLQSPKIRISSPPMPSLSSIQVPSFMCHFHQDRISPPSGTQKLLHLSTI